MAGYAAFLRAINVGGRVVKGPQLIEPLEAIGLEDVKTFRASGNMVFTAGREPVGKLTKRIEQALEDALGYDVAVFLRTGEELGAIAAHEPFPKKAVAASKGKLQVFLLGKALGKAAQKDVMALETGEDRLAIGAREVYWLPSGNMRDAELDLRALGKLLGPTTQRTMGTIEAMASKFFG